MNRIRWIGNTLLLASLSLCLTGCWAETEAETDADTLTKQVAALQTEIATLKAGNPTPAGLAVIAPTVTPTTAASPTLEPTVPPATGPLFEIISIDSRVTESNSVWWRNAWLLTIQNVSDNRLIFDAKIEFKDADGFVIDDENAYDLFIDPNETKEFTGYALIDASVAPNVSRISANVEIANLIPVPVSVAPAMPTTQVVPATPTPEVAQAALVPTETPVAVSAPSGSAPTTDQVVNLRVGPGTDFAQAGTTKPGAALIIVLQSADGAWVQLADGNWLASQFVLNLPADLPFVVPSTIPVAAEQSPAAGAPATVYNRHMIGNAQPPLPPPSGNDFDVILLKRDDNLLSVFMRNNTNIPVYQMIVDVVARAADGSMLGTTDSIGSQPRLVYPGEVTYNTVYFGDLVLPSDAQFDYDVRSRPASENEGHGDLTITEHNLVQDRYVGMATNATAADVSLMQALLLCFDNTGNFLGEHSEFTPKSDAAPGAVIPFEVELDGDSCPTYLLWVGGLSF